jgi:hypothetical protein
VSRGQRGGSPTVVNLSFLDRNSEEQNQNILTQEYGKMKSYFSHIIIVGHVVNTNPK